MMIADENGTIDLDATLAKARIARTREIIKEIEIMELNIHDLDFPIDRCIAGEKSEREKALELAGEIIMPKVKEALKSHLKTKYLSE